MSTTYTSEVSYIQYETVHMQSSSTHFHACRDNGPNMNIKRKAKIEQDGRGHVYQTLDLDELDYESMYTHTVPVKETHNANN